jgi:UTP--glucose-1-phosphate uridylyltransferase
MSHSGNVRKAVIPVAGLGTRFLPATKATPKEMLPVVDKPAIQYVVEEATAAGLNDVLFITGRSKRALEDHFDANPDLEGALVDKHELLASVRDPAELADIHYVRQGAPLGLGHAIGRARQHVGNEPFAVLLGDDLVDPRDYVLQRMIEVRQMRGGSVLLAMEVDESDVHKYGIAAVEATDEPDVVRVTDLVEKPSAADAPSRYALLGRYVIDPAVFEVLDHTKPGRGGEIQITDALRELATLTPAAEGGGVHAVLFSGRRYDTGDKQSYLQAVVQLAAERDDLGPRFRAFLRELVATMSDEPE